MIYELSIDISCLHFSFYFYIKAVYNGKKREGTWLDIQLIYRTSKDIYKRYRKQMFSQFFFIGYMSLLAQYLQSGLFSFFVSLFLCPISHGYVKCSMRFVDEEDVHIDFHDSLIGLTDFVRLAPSYLIRKFMMLMIMVVPALFLFVVCGMSLPNFSLEWLSSLGEIFIQTEFFVPDFEDFRILIQSTHLVVIILICSLFYIYVNALFMPVPYIVEEEDFSWNEALIASYDLMKGHMWDYWKLCLYYAFRHIIYWVVTGVVLFFVGSMNDMMLLICMVASLFFYVEVFKGRFEIAKYLFFKEMRNEEV